MEEIIVDSFAGGGGASTGIEVATGRVVNIAINHDADAILMHSVNHPFTEHYQASVWDIDPEEVCKGRPVGLAWFSPDCKHFSKAKGSALVDKHIRGLAWIVLRWAATVRPRVIMLENVEEFQTWGPVRKGKPVKKKACKTFQQWKWQLMNLGYEIEHRELMAADYGAPTSRKRFVLVARCDGRPIVWPERTHAPADHPDVIAGKLLPWRSAAEIIDWTQPMYSIFATKQELKERYGVNAVRPLADNTMRRTIRGVDKFTIKSGKPFLVPTGYGDMSAANVIQYHTEQTEAARVNGLTEPMPTVDASNRYGLTAAHLTEYYGNGQPVDLRDPAHTVTAHDREALTAVHLDKYFGGGYSGCGNSADEPITTITAEPRHSICAAHFVEFKGQDKGQSAADPLRTITASAGEFGVCSVKIERYAHGAEIGYWPEIRELLNKYCGYTLAEDEILLLNISGIWYFISDIGLRMLTPRELYNAMGFPPDYIIDFVDPKTGKEYSKSAKVARCGNAVCPPMAEAVVRSNLPEWCGGKIETMEQLRKVVAV
ncbi:MAG: DNA cytosine methyltransferase [Oscillospiraceae bacterium]|nr:DNA cytosine methyltransferase [Oscillospiraceae bacterium]